MNEQIIKCKLLGKRKKKSKKWQDAKRGAHHRFVKLGDTVILVRQPRDKAESRFGSHKYTVTEELNGVLSVTDENGQIIKNTSYDWRRFKEVNKPEHSEDNRSNSETSSSESQVGNQQQEYFSTLIDDEKDGVFEVRIEEETEQYQTT